VAENLIFILPNSLEESLWALPVLGQYLENRLVSKRGPDNVHVVCPVWELREVVSACWKGMTIDDKLCSAKKDKANFIMDFDADRAYKVTHRIRKHISEAYGVMVGAVPSSLLPPVAQWYGEEQVGQVLLVDRSWMDTEREDKWPGIDEFIKTAEQEGIPVKWLSSSYGWKNMVRTISQASVVVGVEGSATLLAATFNKIVLEFSPPDWHHRNWMTKWENRKYRYIRKSLDQISAEYVWERLRFLVKGLGDNSWEPPLFNQ
jgi:hypothetical protein